ncbi:hypothetical protein BC827DRAFT_1250776 [Russula dissimulans]|nr:hypothetical protein BC827DRAFT_1250776 [Russula dissimulans]
MYVEWSELEIPNPAALFQALVIPVQQLLQSIITNILSFRVCLTTHSSSSGHAPPTHSSVRVSLLGLGSTALHFRHTYLQYLIFVRLSMSWNMFCLPFLTGRTHQATNH